MRKLLAAIALVALASVGAQAQQMDHSKMDHSKMDHSKMDHSKMDHSKMHMQGMSHDSSMMKSPCPLHLASLDLSDVQKAAVDSVRKAHQADMKALMTKYAGQKDAKLSPADREAMEKSMASAISGARAVLTDSQKVTFDAAVAAHDAEMKQLEASGKHDCLACCADCDTHCDMMHEHAKAKG